MRSDRSEGSCLQVEKLEEKEIPQWDEKNPLCPRTIRSNGEVITLFVKSLLFMGNSARGGHSHTRNESVRDRGQSEVKGSTSFSR